MEDIKKETENIRLPWKATMKIKKNDTSATAESIRLTIK